MTLKVLASRTEWLWALKGLMAGLTLPTFCLGAGLWPHDADGALARAFDATLIALPVLTATIAYRIGLLRRRIAEDRKAAEAHDASLAGAAFTDRLTGLPNRRALEGELAHILADDPAVGKGHGFILLDLDRFQFVNDTVGREAGDQILLILSQRLRAALGNSASVYRPGADEFVIIVPGTPSRGKVEDVARIVGGVLREPFQLQGGQFWTGGSIGVTFLKAGDTKLSDILGRADLALCRSKELMGNSVVFHEPGLTVSEASLRAAGRDFERAISAGDFFLEYQPIIGVQCRNIRSMEALVRWRHPDRGVVSPGAFIAAAEKTGAMRPLGCWIMRTACRDASTWPRSVGVSVNVSGEQIRDDGFVSFVGDCLRESGLDPRRLTIEVTESVFATEPFRVSIVFQALRSLGVRIALDDFGVGFSSLENLRLFPLDQLKIDRSFTEAMLSNKRDGELIDLILKLGAAFRVSTLVEGVETEGQLEFVRAMGAAEVQGFLISPPVPAGDVAAMIAAFEARSAAAASAA